MGYSAKKVPVALAGVMLGTFSLGNLLQLNDFHARYYFGGIGVVLLVMIIHKIIVHPDLFREEIGKPIPGGVLATLPMSLSLLAGYLQPFSDGAGRVIWYGAMLLHVIIIVFFTRRYILKFHFTDVYTSYFIVYVGLAVNGIIAPQFNRQDIGYLCFAFGLLAFILLFFVILYRYVKIREISEDARPLVCIFAAPASLCLTSYLKSSQHIKVSFVYLMVFLSLIIYLAVLYYLPGLLKLKFYPSYAAFTFPFVISATAMKLTADYLRGAGLPYRFFAAAEIIQTALAFVLVVYTLIRYFIFLLAAET